MKKTPDKDPFASGGRQGRTSVTPMNAEDAELMEMIVFLGEEDERSRRRTPSAGMSLLVKEMGDGWRATDHDRNDMHFPLGR